VLQTQFGLTHLQAASLTFMGPFLGSVIKPVGRGLADLFGERSRWGNTLQPVQFAQVSVMVPSFTGETETDLVVPCTYDMDIAATRYFQALTEGEVPLLMLFSGTAFTGDAGFHVEPVPWDREAAYR
ncbi:DUF6084 family protein, partial [Streptomyces sp. WM6368]|uniref:DUF6084 family protein n=1 Tax=Streptomyces sp. WM6368 TaxID=1415554 RepID=UPI001F1C62DB